MLKIDKVKNEIVLDVRGFSATGGKLLVRTPEYVHEFDGGHGETQPSCGDLKLDLAADVDGAIVITLENNTSRDIRIDEIRLEFSPENFASPLQARKHRHLVHNWDFCPKTCVKSVAVPTAWAQVNQPSGLMTVISNEETGLALLMGALPPYCRGFTFIEQIHATRHMQGEFGLRIYFDMQLTLRPSEKISTAPLIAMGGAGGEELIERYADITAGRIDRKRKPTITGWSSWDYYAGCVQRSDMDENRRACNEKFPGLLNHIIIDDGYQRIWGHWESNWKFPEGLADYCRATAADGYRPGVWTAPLMVSVNSPLYRQNPHWFVAEPDGNVSRFMAGSWGKMSQLDPTHPEVIEHLRELFTRLRGEGFKYFKVDFTQALMQAGRFHDPTVGRAGVLRDFFMLIRKCVGEESYILACGAPYEAVLGVVDGVRSSGDIHNYFTMVTQCCMSTFSRLWLQRAGCNIDPDFLIVRSKDTSDDNYFNSRGPTQAESPGMHWLDGAEFDIEGAKAWLLACYLAGGDVVLGDSINKLNDTGLELIRRVITPPRKTGLWVNQFDPRGQHYPVIVTEIEGEKIVGVFNMTADTYIGPVPSQRLELPDQARDFWTDDVIDITSLRIPSQTSLGLRFM